MLSVTLTRTIGDNSNWKQAMNSPFANKSWELVCTEVETLEKMDAWNVVEREVSVNVLPSTWAFKCKRYTNGSSGNAKLEYVQGEILDRHENQKG